MTEKQIKDADYYRICATEMMVRAQVAPSQGIRRAYLNLALKWQASRSLASPENN